MPDTHGTRGVPGKCSHSEQVRMPTRSWSVTHEGVRIEVRNYWSIVSALVIPWAPRSECWLVVDGKQTDHLETRGYGTVELTGRIQRRETPAITVQARLFSGLASVGREVRVNHETVLRS